MPVLVSDTGKEDTVVKGGLAVVEDSALVGRPVGGIDGNGNGSSAELASKIVAVLDILEAGNLEVTTLNLAGVLLSNIGVFLFSGNSVLHDEFEGIVHKTSVASVVSEAG